MKISTSVRYGIRVMLDIAQYGDQNAVGRQVIAERQQVTPEYIAQIVRKLTRAGLLETLRGPGGGYRLGRASDLIRLGDIYRAVEGPVAVVPCVSDANSCCRSHNCATRVVWLKLSRLINDYIDSINLSELTGIANQLEDASAADCQSIVDFVESGLEAFGTNREDCSLMER
jgi:Rrf2 family iron-sulfur cluster assembly transcriptional regulator